jgi:hypothetical protein
VGSSEDSEESRFIFAASVLAAEPREREQKKTGAVENLEASDRAGLLSDGPPEIAGASFVVVIRQIQIISGSRGTVIPCRLP